MNLGELDGRILVFGGPYSNLAATQAMCAQADKLGIPADRVICTGDLVAYCAEASETVDFIRNWGIPVVMGNCEESLADESDDCGCGFDEGSACSLLSVTWYRHANAQVRQDQRRWMAKLPDAIDFRYQGFKLKVIHATVECNNRFVFASDSKAEKRQQIASSNVDVIIGGHSGIPFGQRIDDYFWLNAGVIGMPANNGSSNVWYMLLEPANQGFKANWRELSYNYQTSQETTAKAGMVEYAKALSDGMWPSMDVLPDIERQQQGRELNIEPLVAKRL